MRTGKELWTTVSMQGLRPIPKVSVSEWADENRIISTGAAEPGRWNTSRTPYMQEIMDSFTMPDIHRVVVMSSAQVGKTEALLNIIGRFAHLDPCTIMVIDPTLELAQDFSKTRLSPMLRDTPALSKLFHNASTGKTVSKTRDGNDTILSKIFPGGRLIMCGANSPAGLASRPIRVLLADEVDRFPDSAGSEGDPVDIAAKRTTTYWNRVMGLFSTPTVEGASRIDAEYQAGTQEQWSYQCPNCGEWHVLRYIDMDTEHEEHKDTQGRTISTVSRVEWRCPDCGFQFSERQIKDAPQKYIAQNPEARKNGIRSFFVNAFSSPWMPWSEIMREWFEAKGDPTREQVIVNTRFGEPYRQPGAFEDEMVFVRRREQYGAELPDGVLLLTASVDTQDNRLEYEICGWGAAEESWGISRGVILGTPDREETWAALDEVLDRVYYFSNDIGLTVTRTFIDSGGHYTGAVYQYCHKNWHKQRIPIKGQGGPGLQLLHKLTKAHNSPVALMILGVDDGKQMVMNRLAIDTPGPSYFHFPLDGDEGMEYRGYDQIYFKGIISEHKKRIKKNGVIHTIWETTAGIRNEPLDLRVYNLAAMQSCQPNWDRLAEAVGKKPAPEKTPASASAPQRIPQQNSAAPRQTMKRTNIW